MTQTRNKPIPRSARPGSENGDVKDLEWVEPRQRRKPVIDSPAALLAVLITMLGVLGGALLLGWSMFQVADLLGLLSS